MIKLSSFSSALIKMYQLNVVLLFHYFNLMILMII